MKKVIPHAKDPDALVDWRKPAKRVGLQQRAFWQLVRDTDFPRYRINARVVRFRMSEVETWLNSRRVGALS